MVGSCTTLIGKSAIAQVERTPMVKPGQTWKNATVHNSSGFSEVWIGMSAFVRITKLQNSMVKPMVRHGATLFTSLYVTLPPDSISVRDGFWLWLEMAGRLSRFTSKCWDITILKGICNILPVQMNKKHHQTSVRPLRLDPVVRPKAGKKIQR